MVIESLKLQCIIVRLLDPMSKSYYFKKVSFLSLTFLCLIHNAICVCVETHNKKNFQIVSIIRSYVIWKSRQKWKVIIELYLIPKKPHYFILFVEEIKE